MWLVGRDGICVSRALRPSERRLALLIGDAAAVVTAVLLALWTWSITAGHPYDAEFLRERSEWFATVPVWLILLTPTRQVGVAMDSRRTAHGILGAGATMLVIYLGAFFYSGGEHLPRLMALYLFWDAMLLVFAVRIVALWSLTRAPFSRRVLVVGSGQALLTALELLKETSFRDAELVGVSSTDPATNRWTDVGPPADIDHIARRLSITDLIVAFDGRHDEVDDQWVKRLLRCQESGTHVGRLSQIYEDTLGRVPVQHVGSSWLLANFLDVAQFRDASPLAKRLFDIVAATALAALGLLVVPLIALAIVISSGRPVLYRQQRLGRGGRPFQITKFRTMRRDAESDGEAKWSTPNDPRITGVGRLLRRTRLDELPNLISVLKGDMSMVGPRPERPEFIEQLEREVPLYRARLIVAPGLTGWAQVNWAYGDSVRDAAMKLEYDLYYIKHQSVSFDALILARTIGTILRFGGR